MASAQVLQNSAASSSRKLGHLEAGKRRLEEFRKKKAEGKSKKTASIGTTEVDLKPKESVGDETLTISSDETLKKDNSGLPKHEESSSNSTSSNSKSDIKNTYTSHEDSSPGGITDLKSQSIGVDFDRWRPLQSSSVEIKPSDSSSLGTNFEIKSRFTSHEDGTSNLKDQQPGFDFDRWRPLLSSSLDIKPSDSASPSTQIDIQQSSHGGTSDLRSQHSGVDLDRWRPSQSSSIDVKPSDSASPSRKFDAISRFTSHEDSSRDGTSDLKSQFIGVDFDRSHHLQDSSVDSGSILRNSSAQLPSSSSASSPATSWRTRPSFRDFLNRPKPSSSLSNAMTTTNSFFAESAKAVSMHFEGTGDPISAPSDSKSDGKEKIQGKDVMDGLGKRLPDLPTSVKDEDFAALEQHIEDLTQEKFSLQRALESSRSLAESLASENSSLTENYNQQRKIVNELKSEMEHLQEQFRFHLREVDAAKMESASAQLECSAADERAKILASEVIGLEEKTLRLRSNELKLEKQLESLNAEIGSHKRKISSLEKERQDFQSTIEAMQEEKKLLLDKVRKTSTNDRVDTQKASVSKKDSFTSTEDLVAETSNSNEAEAASSPDTDFLSRNVSASVLPSESRLHFIQDVSVMIPHDQQRMIDNISSLISELTLEKEELVRVLRTKSSDFSKLMDTNKDLSQKLERQTQRLEFVTAQKMASESASMRPVQALSIQETTGYTDEGDEVVERVLSWIMKIFPGGPSKRRTSKLL